MPSPIAPLNPPEPTMEHVIARMAYLYLPWRNNEDVCPRMYFLPLEWDVGECRLPDQTRPWIDGETDIFGWRGFGNTKNTHEGKKRWEENEQKDCWSDTLVSFEPGFVWAQKAFQIQRTEMCLIPLSLTQPFQNSPSKKEMVKAFFSRNFCKCGFFILTNRQGTCTTNLNSSLLIIPLLSESNAWKVCRPRCSIKLWSRWLRTHPPLAAWQ